MGVFDKPKGKVYLRRKSLRLHSITVYSTAILGLAMTIYLNFKEEETHEYDEISTQQLVFSDVVNYIRLKSEVNKIEK